MNIEIPEMDGHTAVTEIRELHAQLPIIMFSTLSQRGARETLDALYRGANDYVSKPSSEENFPGPFLQECPKLTQIEEISHS